MVRYYCYNCYREWDEFTVEYTSEEIPYCPFCFNKVEEILEEYDD
jgi:hypothetical protein